MNGNLPESLARLPKLSHLLLNENNLEGGVPVDLGTEQPLLKRMNLAGNSGLVEPPRAIGFCIHMEGNELYARMGLDGTFAWEGR